MLARAVWLLLMLLLTSSGFLPASMRPDCGGVLLPTVTYNTLRYALLMTNSVNGTKCSWILQAASTETLELEVISYQTVSWTDASCTSTYLAIKLGPTQKERRFCDPFQSIPEVGRKLLFRGKGTAVVTLQSAYGMKQGFALRYSVLVPDPSRREIDARALELQTMSPLPSAENEQVDLSQREAGMYSTPTGQGQLIISQYPRTSNVQERQGSPWIHQVSWYPRRPKLSGILSGKRQRTQTQSQPREIPTRRNSKSDSRTKFHPKSLGCQTSKEKPKISPSLASLKVVAVSESNTRRHPYLTSIIQLLSSSTSSPRSHIPSSPSVYTSPPSLSSPSVYTSPPSSSSPSVYNSPLSSSSPNVYTSPPSPSSSSPSVYTSPPSPSSPSVYISSPFPSPSPSSPSVYTSPPSPSSPSVYISSPSPSNPSVYTSSPSHSSLGPIPPGLGPSALSPSGLSPTPSDLSLRTISRSGLRWIAPSPSSLGPSTRSPFGPGWSSPSIPYRSTPTQSILISSSPSPSSPAPRSLSVTSPLTFRSNLTSTLLLSPHLPFSSLPPDNIFENLSGPSSTSPQEDQENVMSQSRPRLSNQPVVDLSEGVWGLSPGSFTESNSGLWPLTSTGTVDPTKINMSQEGVDTTSDANTNLVITSGGEPNVLPKISGELLTSISPRTVQKSTNQSVSRRTEPPGMESEMSLVPVSVPGDEDYHHQWRSRQQDHSSERGLALSAGNEVDPVTQSELQDEVKIPVTLTPAHEFSSPLSVLQGVVEMSRGSGSVSRVERSSTASDTAQSESQSQNSVPSLPASPGELITPQPDQDRKQESESDQHLLSFSQPADLPTSELLSTQNINTQSLVNSLKIDSVAGSMNPLENTHSTLDFKGSSSDFDGSFTQTFGPVVIKPTSRAWNMFEIPELMTHSSNLPGQEVANDAETDTAAMISESGPTARLPEIVSAVSSLSGADTTQRARPLSAVTGDNDLMSTNKFPRSFSFTSGISLTAISDVASGGEIVSSEVTGGGGDVTGWESETLTVRDTTIKDDGNVTQFTFTKDRMTKESANHSQRLEVTQRAENNTGFWVISGISVAKKDSGRGNTLRDSATEMMARTKPSEKTLWFERRTILPPNVGGENTGSSPTGHNVVSRDKVPLFNLRTPAPESITSQTVANVSSLFIGDDHSASPSREIFPTLSLSELPEQSSTSFEEPLPLTSVRETIASTSSNTTVSRGNTMSFPCSKLEPQMSDGERLRETSATAMNQTFQEGTVLNKPVVTSGTPTLIQGSWSEMQLDSRATASPALPGLTSSVVTVTDVPQLLPFVSTFETAPRLSSDQTGTGHSQILSSPSETSGVSDLRETAWQNIMNLKATPPSPPAFPSAAEEEEAIATGVGSPSSWALQMNQSGSQPVDGSLGPSVTHVDTKDLKRDAAQTVKPWANEWWQKEILSTFATEHFWTWSWFDLGTSSISHGVAPTSGSSAPPEGTTPHPAVTMIPRSVTTFKDPIAVTPGSDNSWTSGRDGPSLFSPTLGTGTSMSPVPTSWPLHLPIDTTPPERAVQTATQQYTPATLGELSNSVLSFTPMERHKSIFIVENELPMIKEGATLKIPTKLILAMNFTLQLGDPTSDEYQNLAKDFTHKVSPFYKKVPGFQQLLIKHFRAGSVLIEFDVVFIAKDIRGYLLDPSSIINITGLNDVIADGFEIGGAQVLRVYVSEGFIALCGQVFSCQTGFQCIHTDRRNVTCTSLCHTDYCKNSGICTHTRGQEPMCQCPVGMDYWFMGPRCDHRMTRQSLIGIVFGVILSVLLVMTAVAVVVLRRFKILLIEAKIDQTKSSYKRFSQFDDFSSQYHSQSWLNYSVSSLNNPGFSNSDELVHLQMLDSSYHSCHEESLTGIYSSWRTTPHGHFRHSLQNNLDISINSINELAGDSGKDSDLSIYSWPTDPLQWSPFPILYQLSRDKPFTAQRPRSYCEGMELVSLEKNWTA